MTRRATAVAGLVAMLGMLVAAGSARAAPTSQQGWWRGSSPLDAITTVLPGLGQVSAADVPTDGLLVQGGTSGPAAYAALAFPVGTDEIAAPLRLVPDPQAASVPGSQLQACPLDAPSFTPAQGGDADAAPSYDCFASVLATVDTDGSYLFDLRTLRRDDTLAVAILPVDSSARVVFTHPGTDALSLVPAAPPRQEPTTTEAPEPPATLVPPPIGQDGAIVVPSQTTPTTVEPPEAAPSGPAPDLAGAPAAAAAAATGQQGTALAILLGAVAAAGCGLWVAAGQLGLRRLASEVAA